MPKPMKRLYRPYTGKRLNPDTGLPRDSSKKPVTFRAPGMNFNPMGSWTGSKPRPPRRIKGDIRSA